MPCTLVEEWTRATRPLVSTYPKLKLSAFCGIHLSDYRVSLTILSAQETQRIPWADKDPRAFFRGRDSNQARLDLVKRHRKDTTLFDVGIVAWFFFNHDEKVYGPVAKRVGFDDFFKVRIWVGFSCD